MRKSQNTDQFLQAVRDTLARRAPLDLEAILESCATSSAPDNKAPRSPDVLNIPLEHLEYAIRQALPKEAATVLQCADMVTEIVSRFAPEPLRKSLVRTSRETTYRVLIHEEAPFSPRKLSESILMDFQTVLPHLEPRSVATMIQRRLALPPFAPPPRPVHGADRLSYATARSAATPEGAPIRHAGLVLTAPYLPRLFAMLGLVELNAFASDDHKARALRVLHYLVAGHDTPDAHDFALEKVLCGVASEFPNPDGIRLEPNETTTCDQLLGGIIQNWKAIGNTSPQGLRETFLNRDGTLRLQDESWHLTVPSKTFDVLVDRIPWGFSMIRFPWMEFPLQTKWRDA